MKSLLLLSVVIAALAIPAITSRIADPRKAMARMILWIFIFNVIYLAYITMLHPVLFVPHWP